MGHTFLLLCTSSNIWLETRPYIIYIIICSDLEFCCVHLPVSFQFIQGFGYILTLYLRTDSKGFLFPGNSHPHFKIIYSFQTLFSNIWNPKFSALSCPNYTQLGNAFDLKKKKRKRKKKDRNSQLFYPVKLYFFKFPYFFFFAVSPEHHPLNTIHRFNCHPGI